MRPVVLDNEEIFRGGRGVRFKGLASSRGEGESVHVVWRSQ